MLEKTDVKVLTPFGTTIQSIVVLAMVQSVKVAVQQSRINYKTITYQLVNAILQS